MNNVQPPQANTSSSNILNSDLVNWLIKFALSKGGFAVSALVTFVVVHLGLPNLIPAEDLAKIETGLNAGGIAIVSIFYAWISSRQNKGVKALQLAHNRTARPEDIVAVDGIAGNAMVGSVLHAKGINPNVIKASLSVPR
jgi:hypothetical protein